MSLRRCSSSLFPGPAPAEAGLQVIRQALRPIGYRPGAQTDDQIAIARDIRDRICQVFLTVDGDDTAMATGSEALGQSIAIDTLDRVFARRVDRGDDDLVGVVEAGAELFE